MKEKKCFVVCPISEEGTETRKRYDDLLKFIITPACEASGYEPVRVDQLYHTDKIDNKIIELLDTSDLVIADVTEQNANVFFELGYRMATKKPVIQMASEGTKLPFDIVTKNTIFYATNDLGKAENSKQRLSDTIKHLAEQTEALAEISEGQSDEGVASLSSAKILSNLYQIQDSITDLKNVMITNNDKTIESVVKAMHSVQPQVKPEMQMLGTLLQTPDGLNNLMKLAEMSGKYPPS
jgi:nucleoside 2-deoxyribosyltransferase